MPGPMWLRHQDREIRAHDLLWAVPEYALGTGTPLPDLSALVDRNDRIDHAIENRLQAGASVFGVPFSGFGGFPRAHQLSLSTLAFGDIAEDRGEEPLPAVPYFTHGEFNRKLSAVLADRGHLPSAVDQLRIVALEKRYDMARAASAISLGEQDRNAIAHHILGSISKYSLRPGTPLPDLPTLVKGDDRVEDSIENRLQASTATFRFLLQGFAAVHLRLKP